jgi:hypothetical protein
MSSDELPTRSNVRLVTNVAIRSATIDYVYSDDGFRRHVTGRKAVEEMIHQVPGLVIMSQPLSVQLRELRDVSGSQILQLYDHPCCHCRCRRDYGPVARLADGTLRWGYLSELGEFCLCQRGVGQMGHPRQANT